MSQPDRVEILLGDGESVSGLLLQPPAARALYVMAHGAGAGMGHPFMTSVATGLAERGVATLRYQFPFIEHGSRRPDGATVAQATVRAAVGTGAALMPGVPLVAGGKSFGGRMTSQAQAEQSLPNARGLVLVGFPLHPAKRPSAGRARHLADVRVPMLFLQGTRDALADMDLLRPTLAGLGRKATLHAVPDADHAFHVPVRSGRNDTEVLAEILDAMVTWIGALPALAT